MRIVAKISGAGHNGLTRMPFLGTDSIDRDLTTDGHFDEAKFRRMVAALGDDGVQIASTDTVPVFAFAAELLKQTRSALKQMIARRRPDGDTTAPHAEAACREDRTAQRFMNRGRVVYVREDITYRSSDAAVRFRVDIQNPLGIVGPAERIALDYALVTARIANNISDQLVAAHGEWRFDFAGGPGCPTLFDDARTIEGDLAARAEAERCANRVGAYCSPARPECRFYRRGGCLFGSDENKKE